MLSQSPLGRRQKRLCIFLLAGKVSKCVKRVVLQKAVSLATRKTRFGCSHRTNCYTSQQLVQEPPPEGQSCDQPPRVRETPQQCIKDQWVRNVKAWYDYYIHISFVGFFFWQEANVLCFFNEIQRIRLWRSFMWRNRLLYNLPKSVLCLIIL